MLRFKKMWLFTTLVWILTTLISITHSHIGEIVLNPQTCQNPNDFQCTDGTCINDKKRCDDAYDCPDKSDEVECDFYLCRPPYYQCRNHTRCIQSVEVCDKYYDCPLDDDEENCPYLKVESEDPALRLRVHQQQPEQAKECNENEFKCTNKNCIPADLMCDGTDHCMDNSDETKELCKKEEKNCKGFLCANDRCLKSILWKCDGEDNCGDGSDEIGCTANCTTEHKKFLCKDRVSCVDLKQVCDNRNDCPDGSDEGGVCNTNQCASMKCPKECQNLPTESICLCDEGYEYNKNSNLCDDIDECEIYGKCSQTCTNTAGSYKCGCVDRFSLHSDGHTCIPIGDAVMAFGARSNVYLYSLKEKQQSLIVGNLSNTMGVHFDGRYVFWTDISKNMVTLERAYVDKSHRDIWLMIGLISPEDLVVDWLTGNLYFTDSSMKHIGVCGMDGYNCASLVSELIEKPKGIVLNPMEGVMYWTEWGKNLMIARSSMDGSEVMPIVTEDLHSPNGLCLDWPNNRLYWVDSRMRTIESINLKDHQRNVILSDAPKNPLGIGIIGNRLYWSDSGTRNIQSCDKFTGKNRVIEINKKRVYHLHIYHPGLMPKPYFPCMKHSCSHLCLTNSNKSYTCACPPGMELGPDKSTCFNSQKESMLVLAIGSYLITLHPQRFGRLKKGTGFEYDLFVSRIAYNTLKGSVFVADNVQGIIYEIDLETKSVEELVRHTKNVTALAFDHLANNLYWTDAERNTVEIFSIKNQQQAIIAHFTGTEFPIALAIVPENGTMYIGLQSFGHTHIDMLSMSGRGNHQHMIENGLGSRGALSLHYDDELQVIFWCDQQSNKIESSDLEGLFRHIYGNKYVRSPVAVTTLDENLYWTSARQNILYYGNKYNPDKYTMKIPLAIPPRTPKPDQILLASMTPLRTSSNHPCSTRNGGCSDICVAMGKFESACMCPPGFVFEDFKNRTCIKQTDCEFRCGSGECIPLNRRCNHRKDCADNSDETGDCKHTTEVVCSFDMFRCESGSACIPKEKLCDHYADCDDKSDESETNCKDLDPEKKCLQHQFTCPNGRCIDMTSICDQVNDCEDNADEDEKVCGNRSPTGCGKDMFRCSTGQCIPKAWECDAYIDCNDASDEHLLCKHGVCPANFYKCKTSYECIPNAMICDDQKDCRDGSDESDCRDPCPAGKFACKTNTSICLDDVARCNGTAECPRGDDEMECANCTMYEFQCRSGTCINKDFICDGYNDCKDGSDEMDCKVVEHYRNPLHHDRECIAGTFSCKDGTCIDNIKVCDGTPDCHDGYDESGKCHVACLIDNPCTQRCQKTPTGPVCDCDPGFELAGNHKDCLDINECQTDNPCAQKCDNTVGTFLCSCFSDFMLRSDKITCKSFGSPQYLLYTTKNQLRKMTFNPTTINKLHETFDNKFMAMDVHIPKNSLYFSIDGYEALFQFNVATNNLKTIEIVGIPTKIAVDWITDNVYYVDQYANIPTIQACHVSEKRTACVRIKEFRRNERIGALIVDPINRYLFYAILHYRLMGARDLIIYRTRMDGTGLEVVLQSAYDISAMAIDYNKKLLYFTDREKNTLHSVKYDGNDTKILIEKTSIIHTPIALNIFEDHAYILNEGSNRMVQCSLYGHRECRPLDIVMGNVDNLVMIQESRQKLIRNVCESNKCKYMCVPSDKGAKCLCHQGNHVQENTDCEEIIEKIEMPQSGAEEKTSSSGVTIFLVVFFCVIVVGAGLFVFCKKRYQQGRFNVSMHFENPSLHNIDAAKVNMVNPPEILCSNRRNEVHNNNFTSNNSSSTLNQSQQKRIGIPSYVFGALDDDISLEDEPSSYDDNPRTRLIM